MAVTAPLKPIGALPALTEFTGNVVGADSPRAVLEALQVFAAPIQLNVFGAARLPVAVGDWRSLKLGRDIFLHSSVPPGWWNEYETMARREFDPGVMMARSSLMACTLTETRQMLDPIGIDQWPYDLALKYGVRDLLSLGDG